MFRRGIFGCAATNGSQVMGLSCVGGVWRSTSSRPGVLVCQVDR